MIINNIDVKISLIDLSRTSISYTIYYVSTKYITHRITKTKKEKYLSTSQYRGGG